MSCRGSSVMATGFFILLLAVSAGFCFGGYGSLLGVMGVLAGANMIAFSVRMADNPMAIGATTFPAVRSLAAFPRRDLAVAGLILASSAVTAVADEASPVLFLGMYALLLLGISMITIGVRV